MKGKRPVLKRLFAFTVVLVLTTLLFAPTVQAATPAQIEAAIDNGLAWLAAQQAG